MEDPIKTKFEELNKLIAELEGSRLKSIIATNLETAELFYDKLSESK